MIRPCVESDFDTILEVVNEAAEVYRGVIPVDCWRQPYMPPHELRAEIDAGVRFVAWDKGDRILGVMGIQDVADVSLIRHAYVRPTSQRRGVGGVLLTDLRARPHGPLLVGTWAAATWAVRFYERHSFRLVTPQEKDLLLHRYWSIPERQVETSVVLRATE